MLPFLSNTRYTCDLESPVLGLQSLYLGFSLPQLTRRSNPLPNYYLRACIRQRKRLKSPVEYRSS